jgi:hypothetical protein
MDIFDLIVSNDRKGLRKLIQTKSVSLEKRKFSETPLMFAVQKNRYRMCKMLIKAGADVHTTNREGKTAFFLAVMLDKVKIALFIQSQFSLRDAQSVRKAFPKNKSGAFKVLSSNCANNSWTAKTFGHNVHNANMENLFMLLLEKEHDEKWIKWLTFWGFEGAMKHYDNRFLNSVWLKKTLVNPSGYSFRFVSLLSKSPLEKLRIWLAFSPMSGGESVQNLRNKLLQLYFMNQ